MSKSSAGASVKVFSRLPSRVSVSVTKPEIYDFAHKLREKRAKELEWENALLARGLSEIQAEIIRLRKLLARS
jgi:hypothetical protein